MTPDAASTTTPPSFTRNATACLQTKLWTVTSSPVWKRYSISSWTVATTPDLAKGQSSCTPRMKNSV
ncbi:hypothetical protein PUNSTDRAFT_49978 [Punctularia strigosozonata HHB-11173 SS5]|uniref:uncharacterized protein n=1 Tax=Punctularia strigosozonata (strain HHB-11173) TaxID=741275 RepID=UPI00044168A9|nr:uncharacterized protein PUNSTDRAFT_49978 [Punctularia strigosozonata HHB-11173 SS5]EIN12723.1 hypothetical protein PUNSTDRAFT_49978 [Punctularia strigosozonata HHB-11173 SS5]